MSRTVSPWYICTFGWDHIYDTCPHYKRTTGWKSQINTSIDGEGFGVCGWCRRVWRARTKATA